MMKNIVYVATSLDGFIAGIDGDLDWLNNLPNPDRSDYGFADFIRRIDALVMGRNTFETVLAFDAWPYPKPVFVLSSSLKKIPATLTDKVEIVQGDLVQLVNDLHRRGYQSLYIDGGRTIQNFLRADLIDELIITQVPILLGRGIPLFGDIEQTLKFSHQSTETFTTGLVQSHYVRDRDA